MSRGLVTGYALLAGALGVVGFSEPLMVDLRLPVSFMLLALAAGFYLVAELQRAVARARDLQRQIDDAKDSHTIDPPDLRLVRALYPVSCDHLAPAVHGVCTRCGLPVS